MFPPRVIAEVTVRVLLPKARVPALPVMLTVATVEEVFTVTVPVKVLSM